jgi:hypothetical protein
MLGRKRLLKPRPPGYEGEVKRAEGCEIKKITSILPFLMYALK